MTDMIGAQTDGAQDGMEVGNGMVGDGNGIMVNLNLLLLDQHNDLSICGVVVHLLQSHLEMINIMDMIGALLFPQSPLWMIYTTIGEEENL